VESLKAALQDHLGRAVTRTHEQNGCEVHQALDCGCQWWSIQVSHSNSIHLQHTK